MSTWIISKSVTQSRPFVTEGNTDRLGGLRRGCLQSHSFFCLPQSSETQARTQGFCGHTELPLLFSSPLLSFSLSSAVDELSGQPLATSTPAQQVPGTQQGLGKSSGREERGKNEQTWQHQEVCEDRGTVAEKWADTRNLEAVRAKHSHHPSQKERKLPGGGVQSEAQALQAQMQRMGRAG